MQSQIKTHLTRRLQILSVGLIVTWALWAAETSDTTDLRLRELKEVNVTVHGDRLAVSGYRLVASMSADEVRLLPVKTVADLLQYIPGVDVRQRGASGVQMGPSIRGGSAKQVKVLLNGIDMTDPQTEHYTMDLPVDALMIERIEVLQGTNYAIDAFSGAINIVTKASTDRFADRVQSTDLIGQMTAGECGLVNPGIMAKGEWRMANGERFMVKGAVSYNRSDGYDHNTDYQIVNAFVQTGYKGLDVQLGAQMKDAGANSFYTTKYPDQFDATRMAFGSVAYQHRWQSGWAFHTNAYYRAHYDRYELFRGTPLNRHWTHTAGAHAEGSWSNEWSKTMVGVDVRNEYIRSTNIGTHNRTQLRYFAEQRFYWRGLSASIGGVGIWNAQFGHDWSVGANIGYEPIQGLHLFANVNRAIRVPTFTDLYYHSATQQSDSLTKPEKALQLELSAQYSKNHWYASVAGYYRRGRNVIDWVKAADPAVVIWRCTNNSKVNAAGVEATVGVQGYEWIRRVELSYAFCDVSADAGGLMSLYVLDYLRHKATLCIEHKIYKGFGASWALSFRQREGEYTSREGTIEHYRPVWLLDGSVFWHNDLLKVSIDARNMADQLYYDFSGVLQPRHWVSATVQFTLTN